MGEIKGEIPVAFPILPKWGFVFKRGEAKPLFGHLSIL
jgi:hypothetical protein